MPIADRELITDFVIESQEGLAKVERQMLDIEARGASIDVERVNAVFRTMHSIKGTAGFLGLDRIETLAHRLEELLNLMRNQEIIPTTELVTAMLSAADFMSGLIESVDTSNEADISSHVAAMDQFLSDRAGRGVESLSLDIKAANRELIRENPELDQTSQCQASPGAAAAATSAKVSCPAQTAASPAVNDAANQLVQTPVGESTIRVDVDLLDKLMTRVGELVLARNQILQHASRVDHAEMSSAAQRLNLITSELQGSVMKTRMQPIGNVWAKFPRVVRDLATQLNKQIGIELEGKETELDKTIIEAIKDPLTHLVRNSVDHGIETPSVRIAAGKNPQGKLLLRAYHEGGQVNIEIIDDGAGLQLDRIRKKAVEKGILSAEQAHRLTDQEASQLIFAAGFSTAEQVTSVSGRGVGMDVVKTNIERIGGVIDVQSLNGAGTTVKIKIPLTLAIIPALTVMCEGDRYAIPQASLLELVRLEGDEARSRIETFHGAPVYRLRGKLLPIVYLSERLGVAPAANRLLQSEQCRAVSIVVLRADDRQFGLVVDKVCDTEEIVVKPLGKQLKKIGEYAGTTIMGDGEVALILDVKGLAAASGLTGEMRARGNSDSNEEAHRGAGSQASMLLVDVGDARRYALPISTIARLEKIAADQIELADGGEVIQYRGAILPLVRLTGIVGKTSVSTEDPEAIQVVVYDQNGLTFGLIVGRILDSCEVSLLPRAAGAPPGHLLGSYVIQQQVTDVVDMHYLGRRLQASGPAMKA